jgi:hypothetical protein
MKVSKKAAIEVQFNWLFVLIIGVVILSFVFTVIRGQMKSTQDEVEATVRTKLDTVLQQAAQTPGTLFTVQLRNTRFTSSDSCSDSFYLNENRNLRIELEAAFSPKNMDSIQGEFILWTLPWELPFRITNFVYLTSPDIVYLLVHDGPSEDFAEQINYTRDRTSLPDSMLKIVLSQGSLENQLSSLNHLNTRVVYVGGDEYCTQETVTFPQGANSAICVEIDSNNGGLDGWGKVVYLRDTQSGYATQRETYFLGRASLFGAIFSEDIVQFDCSMQKAYTRMNNMLDVYISRSNNLTYALSENSGCRTLHNQAKSKLESMKTCLITNPSHPPREECLFENAFRGVQSLQAINQATKLKSCVYVY